MSLSLFSRFYNTVRVSFALPKNDNWRETEMKGMTVGRPHFVHQTGLPGTSVVGVPWEMYGCLMIFSVHLPHCGHDEDNYITELALVSVIMQGKKLGPRIFSVAGTSTLSSHSRWWRIIRGPQCQGKRKIRQCMRKTLAVRSY